MFNRILLPSLIVGMAIVASAREETPPLPTALDIAGAVRLAHTHNPALNESRERLVEQDGLLLSTESSRKPFIDGFGLYQVEDENRIGSFGGGGDADEAYWRAGVQLVQPLYSGGLLNATVRSRRFQSQALEASVEEIRHRVMTQTHRLFYAALLAREVVEVRKEAIELLEKQLELARNRFEAGAGPRFDVLQAEVRLANARPTLIRAVNLYRIAIEELRTILGLPYAPGQSPADIHLAGSLEREMAFPDLAEALAEARENRPDLEALARQRDAAEQDIQRSRAQRAPRINFFANYSMENDRYSETSERLDGWQAGVEARLSLWEGGRIRGETAQAQSRFQQLHYRQDAAHLRVELEVRQAWSRAEEAREILDATNLVITQAEEALRLAENRYAVGSLTQLDVLTSQLELTQARVEQLTAQHDFAIAVIELEAAMGRLPGQQWID
ncbi:MAG TPA: TolC family protein [Kiritimatiellia bacterium]|nr:TolC family protein [Kiritimatiellia bacterium]HMO98769.1 TolC family protein [Kiritimatiellia bacterium]HMP97722.1 TolC family protein [Kiritimatiellia bacterium]